VTKLENAANKVVGSKTAIAKVVQKLTNTSTKTGVTENLYYNLNTVNLPNFTPCYNGNIAGMKWNVVNESLGYQRAYSFDYDDLNRLTNSVYSGNNNLATVSGTLDKYTEKLDYKDDKMGNLKALTRYENGTLVENLNVTYQGNQLQIVDNSISHFLSYGSELFRDYDKHIVIPKEYAYDTNGNMLYDANGGVSDIEYNVLNLPDKIHFTAGHKNLYTYDAGGQKLKLVNYSSNKILDIPMGTIAPLSSAPSDYTVLTTDYVGNMIYENGALKEILLPEGYYQNGTFYYYLKDHLGDNRVTINSSGTVVEKSHYYPSGTRFFTESTSNTLKPLPYRYNGKEMEAVNGLNQMDYGARRRFSWGPIWTSVDPLAEKYYSISPYAYCLNNPVKFIDPDGRVVQIPKVDRKEVLKAINSRAAGTFGINKSGNLYLKNKVGSTGYSEYYRDKLIDAINDKNVINISKGQTFTSNGVVKDVDKDTGGGATIEKTITKTDSKGNVIISKEADVIFSGNENKNIKDTNGNALRDDPADIIMHEIVGHASPWTVGPDTGNAVDNENKARKELAPGQNQERKQDPNHKE